MWGHQDHILLLYIMVCESILGYIIVYYGILYYTIIGKSMLKDLVQDAQRKRKHKLCLRWMKTSEAEDSREILATVEPLVLGFRV